MKEKFEPFKELLKALREIKYAIGGKNSGTGEGGNNIVLPKYMYGYVPDKTSPVMIERLLEIDYDGRIYDFMAKLESGAINPSQLTEEEITNFTELFQNYTTIPPLTPVESSLCVYTKEQKDIINKNTIIMDGNEILLKLNDLVFVDLYDMFIISGETTTLDIQKGQYYIIMHPLKYNSMMNGHGPGVEVVPVQPTV